MRDPLDVRCGIPIALLEHCGLEIVVIDMLERHVGLGIDDLVKTRVIDIINIPGMGATRYQHLEEALERFADVVSTHFERICHVPVYRKGAS